jgi:RNase P subunit RPR2
MNRTFGLFAMANPNHPATLDYLTNASHLLHLTAPETSAHLMSQRQDLLYHQRVPLSDIQRQHVCGACGHILLAGGEDVLKMVTPRRRHKLQRGESKASQAVRRSPCKTISCGHCNKTTRVKLEPPTKTFRTRPRKSKSVSAVSTPVTDSSEAATKPSANASSKKRAKNRKAGLQALLAGQQNQKASPLSLGDFMRK